MIKANFHTHTTFDDGKNSPEEMIKAAIEQGFEMLGFSVHSPMTFSNDWACREDKLDEYRKEINRLKELYSAKIQIFNGIELDSDHAQIQTEDFDYVIAAVHQLHCSERIYSIDDTPDELKKAVKKEFDGDWLGMAKSYYSEFSKYIINLKPDVVAHFDLIEKFNNNCALFDSRSMAYKLMVKLYLEQVCLECPDVIFEINTGAMFRLGNLRPYPAPFIMKFLKSKKMRIMINSDAHSIDSLNYKFNDAFDYCRKYGFEEVYIFGNEGFSAMKI